MRAPLPHTFFTRAVAAAVIGGALLFPSMPVRVVATALLVGVVPGFTILRSSLAVAMSPILFAATILLPMAFGVSAVVATHMATALWLVAFAAFGHMPTVPVRGERRAALGIFARIMLATWFVMRLPLRNLWWRVREDSWFHAAVLERLLHHGLPLEDPYFSGLRLQYPFFYHGLLAGVSTLTRLDPFYSMMLVNAVALAGCALAFHSLAAHFTRNRIPRSFAMALFLFGMNGLFYLFYPLQLGRAFTGATTGAAVLKSFFAWTPMGLPTAQRLLSVEGNQMFFLDKFMLGTAFSLAIGLVCVLLSLVVSARLGRWRPRMDVAFVVCVAGLLHVHAVVGISAWLAMACVLGLLLLIHAHPSPGGPSYTRLLMLHLVALAIAVPYLFAIMPRGGGGGHAIAFAIQWRHLVGLLSNVLPAVLLAIPFLRWTERPETGAVTGRLFAEFGLSAPGIVFVWLFFVAIIASVVDLPTNNETKFAYLLWVPLAAFAAGGIERIWPRRGGRAIVIGTVLASTIPLSVIYAIQARHDPTTFDVLDEERAAYRWIERNSPADAVFIEDHDIVRVPVLAGRDQYWGVEAYALNWGYPPEEIRTRRAIRDDVYAEGGLSEDQRRTLRELHRPIYVIYRYEENVGIPAYEKFIGVPGMMPRVSSAQIAVWEFSVGD